MTRRRASRRPAGGVELVHWNPRYHHLPRPFGRIRFGRPLDNFGDLLGPVIVRRLLSREGLDNCRGPNGTRRRILSVGSIMHFARSGDVVWGTGVNGKHLMLPNRPQDLDVRALRGPKTAVVLRGQGFETPDVHGDPAILMPALMPELAMVKPVSGRIAFVPNFHDLPRWRAAGVQPVSPLGSPETVIPQILIAERVITSSLHGLVVADAFGRPAVLVIPEAEPMFKYEDYRLGIGRPLAEATPDLATARDRIKTAEAVDIPRERIEALLESFPRDLWLGGDA